MGLNTLLRVTSITLLAFVLAALTVDWSWRPFDRIAPALAITDRGFRMSGPFFWRRPTSLPPILNKLNRFGPTVAVERVYVGNRFIELKSGWEAAYEWPSRNPQAGGAPVPTMVRFREIGMFVLRPPSMGVLLIIALTAEGLRLWRHRHMWAGRTGPPPRLAMVSLISGLTVFGLVVAALTASLPAGVPWSLPRLEVGSAWVWLSFEPPFTPTPTRPQMDQSWPEPVFSNPLGGYYKIQLSYWRRRSASGTEALSAEPRFQLVRIPNAARQIRLNPPFFAVMLMVSVGLLAKGQHVIPAVCGRAGFRVENLGQPSCSRQKNDDE